MPGLPNYPLSFEPILKILIWGGRRLGTVLSKSIGEGGRYAESWEIADHRNDVSRVRNGPLAGASLRDLDSAASGKELLGDLSRAKARTDQFPLLVKFLDAHAVLSVQVHPDDERGMRLADDNGKTEAWVILHAEPDSQIYAGLQPGVTRDDFAGPCGPASRAALVRVRGFGRETASSSLPVRFTQSAPGSCLRRFSNRPTQPSGFTTGDVSARTASPARFTCRKLWNPPTLLAVP